MRLRGAAGEVVIGGRVAARVGAWSAETGEGGWSVSAALLPVDAFWMARDGPFALRLAAGSRRLVWRIAGPLTEGEWRQHDMAEPEGLRD